MNLTREEKMNLIAFLKLIIDEKTASESILNDMKPIYEKLRKEFIQNG